MLINGSILRRLFIIFLPPFHLSARLQFFLRPEDCVDVKWGVKDLLRTINLPLKNSPVLTTVQHVNLVDKPDAKAQSKAQSPKKPQKGKRGIWPLGCH